MTCFRLFRMYALWWATILVATSVAYSEMAPPSCPLNASYYCACSLDEEPVVKILKMCLHQKLKGLECHPCPDYLQDYNICDTCPGSACPICFPNEFDFRRHYDWMNNISNYLDINNATTETGPEDEQGKKILERVESGIPHRSGKIENSSHTAVFTETEYMKNGQNESQQNEGLGQEGIKKYYMLFGNGSVYAYDNLAKLDRFEDNGVLSKSDSDGGSNQSFIETSPLFKFLIIEDEENKIGHSSSAENDLNSSKLNLTEGSGKEILQYYMDDLENFLRLGLMKINADSSQQLLKDIDKAKVLMKNNFNQADEMNELNKIWENIINYNLDNNDDVESNTQAVSEERNLKIPKKIILRRSSNHPASRLIPLMFRLPLPLASNYISWELLKRIETMNNHDNPIMSLPLNNSYLDNEKFFEIWNTIYGNKEYGRNSVNLPTGLDSNNAVSKQPSVNEVSNNQKPHTATNSLITVYNFENSTYSTISCKNISVQKFLNTFLKENDLMKTMLDRKFFSFKESGNFTSTSGQAMKESQEEYECTVLYNQKVPTNSNSMGSAIPFNANPVQALTKGIQEKSPNSKFMNQSKYVAQNNKDEHQEDFQEFNRTPNSKFMNQAEYVVQDNKDEHQGNFQEFNRTNFYNLKNETSAEGNLHQKYQEEPMQRRNESEPVSHGTRLLTRKLLQTYGNEADEEEDHITIRLRTRDALNSEPHQLGSRKKRDALPQNRWCTITIKRRHANMECTIWNNRKSCELQCHSGYVIEGTQTSTKVYKCIRKQSKWIPTDILPCAKRSEDTPPKNPDKHEPEYYEENDYDDDATADHSEEEDATEADYYDDSAYYD